MQKLIGDLTSLPGTEILTGGIIVMVSFSFIASFGGMV